jgi:hypothetical protein
VPAKPKTKLKAKRPRKPKQSLGPQDFLAAAEYRIAEVPPYGWACYGKGAIFVDIDIPVRIGSAQMVIDITTNQICEMSACNNLKPKVQQAYMWRNPAYRAAHDDEARARGFSKRDMSFAWDDTKWVNVQPAAVLKRVRELVGMAKEKTGRQ